MGTRPDRVPNGLGATLNTGMHLLAYERFRSLLGLGGPPPRMMSFEANALFDLPVMTAIDADMVTLGLKITPARFWGPGSMADWKPSSLWGREYFIPRSWDVSVNPDGVTWIDGYDWDALGYNVQLGRPNCRLTCPQGGRYFDPVLLPGVLPAGDPTLEKYNPPLGFPPGWLEKIAQSARWLHENTDLSIVCDEMINDFQLTPGGLDGWWMKMATEPKTVHRFLEKACESAVSQLKLLDEAVGGYADLLMIAQDFGDLRGVTIGPELWRQIFKPHFKDLFGEWHRIKPDEDRHALVRRHQRDFGRSDRKRPRRHQSRPGFCARNGAENLVRKFGGRIVFYGGSYDAVSNDPAAPPDAVKRKVADNIRAFAGTGRYIFCGVHNIQWNVPDSHLAAVLAAFKECRESAGA